MPRLTPSVGSSLPELEDDEPYVVEITEAEATKGKSFQDPTVMVDQLKVRLQIPGDDEHSILQWLNVSFGKNRTTGKVSKFRAFLNAVAGHPEDDELAFFDTDDLSWGYADGTSHQILEGQKLTIRGVNGTSDDGYPRFTIEKFRPAKSSGHAASTSQPQRAASAAPQASAQPSSEDIPF